MSSYKGAENFEQIFALPHMTMIMRKPQGIGCEIKSVADGESGILLHLEFMEGKAAQAVKKYTEDFPSSIALTLRCVEYYFGSGKTLHADSAFSSVSTAAALLQRGLHFMGAVKTARSKFPQAYLNAWAEDEHVERGSHKTLISEVVLEDGSKRGIIAVRIFCRHLQKPGGINPTFL
jgi:hypothetical protein